MPVLHTVSVSTQKNQTSCSPRLLPTGWIRNELLKQSNLKASSWSSSFFFSFMYTLFGVKGKLGCSVGKEITKLSCRFVKLFCPQADRMTFSLTTGHFSVRILPQVSVQHSVADLVADFIWKNEIQAHHSCGSVCVFPHVTSCWSSHSSSGQSLKYQIRFLLLHYCTRHSCPELQPYE